MNELHLFAGAGGGILGGMLLGHTCVCAVEIEEYPRKVLLQRQRDWILPRFPIWDDVQTFDGKPWRGRVDIVAGGFPCQDISAAGKGAGIEGEKSSMWKHMARIIGEVQPRFVFVENSPMLVGRGLAVVLGDLAQMGYDARWGVLGAHHAGAPHKRDRIWIVADASSAGREGSQQPGALRDERDREEAYGSTPECGGIPRFEEVRDSAGSGLPDGATEEIQRPEADEELERPGWWATEPGLGRVAHGVANRVHRLKAIGNGQVPAVDELAWRTLIGK